MCAILLFFFFFKQKTAYEMRISDWSSTCALPILPLRQLRHRSVRRRRTGVSKQLSAIFRHPLRSRDRRPLLYELRTGAGRCGGADQPPSGRISVHALHRHRAGLLMSEDDISMAPTPFEEGEDGRAPSRWRRLAIWAAAVLGALAVLVAGLSAYLNSDPGKRMLVRQIGKIDTASGLSVQIRSEEHTSELQSLMRTSYAVFCLSKKNDNYCLTRKT